MEANAGKSRAQPLAWLVHFYTASGAVLAFAAALAAIDGRFRDAFLYLIASTAVDATDGMFARRVGLPGATPRFDGARLDDIVDYLTFVFVPMLILYLAGDLPESWGFAVVAAVLLSSGYGFASLDAKTSDYFFTGFPSYWNIVALYLHAARTPPVFNAVLLLALVVMVFVRIGYVYPSRTPVLQRTTNLLGVDVGGDDAGHRLAAARRATGAGRWIAVLPRLLRRCCRSGSTRAAAPPHDPSSRQDRCRDLHCARDREHGRRDLAAAPDLRRLQTSPRRRRHGVSRRERQAVVPARRAPPRRASQRDTEASARRVRRRRGSSVLLAPRRRPDRARTRGGAQLLHRLGPGRQHADATAGTNAVPVESEVLRPQDPRGDSRAEHRCPAVEGPGPRAVSQPDLLERRGLRRRDDVAESLWTPGENVVAGRVSARCRSCPGAVGLVAVVEPGRRAGAQSRRARAHAPGRLHHRRPGTGRTPRADQDPPLPQCR